MGVGRFNFGRGSICHRAAQMAQLDISAFGHPGGCNWLCFPISGSRGRTGRSFGIGDFRLSLGHGILWVIGRKGMEAISLRPDFDLTRLDGMEGQATTQIFHDGSVYINGEEWSAWSNSPIPAGSRIKVVSRKGLVLEVEALKEQG